MKIGWEFAFWRPQDPMGSQALGAKETNSGVSLGVPQGIQSHAFVRIRLVTTIAFVAIRYRIGSAHAGNKDASATVDWRRAYASGRVPTNAHFV